MPQPHEVQRTTYVPPRSLSDAKIARRKLVEEITGINTQLSNRNKTRKCTGCNGEGSTVDANPCLDCAGTGGVRWPDHEYHAWRQKALTALRARESVLRKLNDWIEQQSTAIGPNANALIGDAYALFRTLIKDDVEFNEDEMQVVESLRVYLDAIDKEPTCQA